MMKKVKIFVVDDSEFMHNMIKDILSDTKYEVIATAFSGREAIEKYQKCDPDIVTMDINMPDVDGITVVKEILKIDNNAKIIMCSGREKSIDMTKALEAGAFGYIQKPFQKKEILKLIDEVMAIEK